jgi:hypothetical protein
MLCDGILNPGIIEDFTGLNDRGPKSDIMQHPTKMIAKIAKL